MPENLEKQVYFYSVDTSAFYDDEEEKIHKKLLRTVLFMNKVNEKKEEWLKETDDEDEIECINSKCNSHLSFAKKRKLVLKKQLNMLFDKHTGIREIIDNKLNERQTISVFDSILTRTLKLECNKLSDDIIIVRSYYYKVLKDIVIDGFMKNNEKYIYFTSSAGQIRTKKSVFIKESVWEKYKNSLTCGLSMEEINSKGGVNTNKYQAYMALSNSASIEWKGFDINRCIVVEDLETDVHCTVDYIDRDTYEIERKKMNVPITHTDGCGMILPSESKICFMVRVPFVKGLLVPFDFRKFCKTEHGNTKIKDIYDKEWDIEKDDIRVIFTKSQFKMWKYYDGWQDYKDRFVKYYCQAAKMNMEDVSGHARLNYQMLQTLNDMTDEELLTLAQPTIDNIKKIGSDRETMLRVLGATKYNPNKNYFQKALLLYPELLNDNYAKMAIKNRKKRLVKEARSGKLNINGKYTFIIPDLYAFCEYLFKGEEVPTGLLKQTDVYCDLYNNGDVDILRSPHLYREHAVRNNIYNENKSEWFITHGIYTSTFDSISKILMFDNDGDKVIVIQDNTLINVAKRNMQDIVPLYYEMAKAKPSQLSREQIYNSLKLAYKENIGEISNNITKIWNRDDGVGEDEIKAMKWLCMENNFVIDFAKTLFKPKRHPEIKKKITSYTSARLPHFFIYAKDKESSKVADENESLMNRLYDLVPPDGRIYFKKIAGKFDYYNLINNQTAKIDQDVINTFDSLNRQRKLLQQNADDLEKKDKLYVFELIRETILNKFGHYNVNEITDMLVKDMYGKRHSRFKTALWGSFGDVIYRNIEKNLNGTISCEKCGKRVISKKNNNKYCEECAMKMKKNQNRLADRKYKLRKSEKS